MLVAAEDTAAAIASKSPLAVRGTKATLNYARDHGVPDSLQQVQLWNSAFLLGNDIMEAVAAVMAKRPPHFKDN